MGLSEKAAARGRVLMISCGTILAGWWMSYQVFWLWHDGAVFDEKIYTAVASRFLGTGGDTFLLSMGSIILLTALGFAARLLKRQRNKYVKAVNKKARLNLWTMPVVLRSPFGMLSMADIIFTSILLLAMGWYMIKSSWSWNKEWDAELTPEDPNRATRVTWIVGVEFGCVALIPFTLLWIPVSRGSPILNVLGIPFESAVKYHIWLGLLTIWTVTLHGILTIAYYICTKQANINGLFSWWFNSLGIIPGFLAGVAGVVMLATSLEWVRRNYYDLFFVTHHLYLLFTLFFSFHCAWCMDGMMIPILLFFLDRFFRAVQSRKKVDIVAAKVLTSGAIELTITKPARSSYHALSFIYIMLPSVSKIMWHPFSVASSPLDETNQIVVYIKPLGRYTEKLHDQLVSSKQYSDAGKKVFKCPFSFKAGVEGSYGSESMFYLRYQTLILVAGGIGVTPFMALIQDILHRYRLKQKDLPTTVELILCVKAADELHVLDTISPETIFPGYQVHLKLIVHAFVTQENTQGSKGDTDQKQIEMWSKAGFSATSQRNMFQDEDIVLYSDATQPTEMSAISSTGHAGWTFAVYAVTIISYLCIFGTFHLKYDMTENSGIIRTMIYLVCLFISVVICGGSVMLLWALWDKRQRKRDELQGKSPSMQSPVQRSLDMEHAVVPLWQDNVIYGRRPVWDETFDDLSKRFAGQNVGVMVSGLLGLQQDVAAQCRSHSLRRDSTVVFHYHSVSFDL